jgi:hypothetical protein
MDKNYSTLVTGAKTKNMEKLNLEVGKLEDLGFKYKDCSGYGEGVFTVRVEMVHGRFGEARLQIAQSPSDGVDGMVMFTPFCKMDALQSYRF